MAGASAGGWLAGLIAVALLGSLPLLAQNATGAGMELTNLAHDPGGGGPGDPVPGATRCAAAFRLRAGARAVVPDAVRSRQSCPRRCAGRDPFRSWRRNSLPWWLSWPAVFAPLLLIPFALQHKVLANTPVLWELTEEKRRFSLDYVPDNLRRAADFS